MKKQPDLSMILVAYKSGRIIGRCLRAAAQSCRRANLSFETILVINDKELNSYQGIFKEFLPRLIVNKENLGFAKGVNKAAIQAKGRLLLILNPDVFLERDSLKYLLNNLKTKNVVLVGPKLINKNGSLQFSIRQLPTLFNFFLQETYLYRLLPRTFPTPLTNSNLYERNREVEALSGACWMMKKKIFIEIGMLDERFFLYFEDMDFCRRLGQRGLKIMFEPRAVGVHLGGASSSRIKIGSQYYKSLILYWKKYYSTFMLMLMYAIIGFGVFSRFIFWSGASFLNDRPSKRKRDYYNEIITFWLKGE
jgi:GT2 family glycosyltransferase